MSVRSHASGDWEHDDAAKVRPDADAFNDSCDEGGVGIVSGECHEDGLLGYALHVVADGKCCGIAGDPVTWSWRTHVRLDRNLLQACYKSAHQKHQQHGACLRLISTVQCVKRDIESGSSGKCQD